MHLLVKKINFDAIKMHDTTINSIYFTYSELPPDDEQLIYSKHVEDDYRNKLRVREREGERKCFFLLLITQKGTIGTIENVDCID